MSFEKLKKAIDHGDVLLVALLIRNISISDVSKSLLHACNGLVERSQIVSMLIDQGANVNYQGRDGWTPLHHSTLWAHRECAEILLSHGADTNIRNGDNQTVKDIAIQLKRTGILGLLE